MDALDTPQLVAIAAALGWASGLRLYAVLFITGLAGTLGWVSLPAGLQLLQHPLMLTASGVMLAVAFFADKIPGVDRHAVGRAARQPSPAPTMHSVLPTGRIQTEP